MLGVTDYGAFVIAFIILLAIPGPGNFALITATCWPPTLRLSTWCNGPVLRTWLTWACACS